MTSPPLPPLPPSGPPYSMNFSRRKETAPGPPAPERMKIFAWSRNCMSAAVMGCGAYDKARLCFHLHGLWIPQPRKRHQLKQSKLAGNTPMHAQRLRQRCAKQGVANRHQRQCHRDFANLVGRRFHRELPDEIANGMEYRIKRLAVTRQNHPDREPARSIDRTSTRLNSSH